jgi:outer membrane protein assembly factor BamB
MYRCNKIWNIRFFGSVILAGILNALSLFGAEQSSMPEPAVTAEVYGDSFAYRGHSPEISFKKTEEGIASDGTNRFLIYRRNILKVDATWTNILASNDAPLAGLKGYDHLGAGEYYQGKIYIATEAYHGCDHVTNQSICVFDANTLKRLLTTSVSNYTSEVSAVTVITNAGLHSIMFVSNFCDDSKLYKFNLSDLSFLGTLPLDQSVPKLQGIAYHDGLIYAVTDSGTNGIVYDIDPNNGHTRKLAFLTFPHGKEVEGCLFDKDRLEVLVASHTNRFNYVYYFSP